MKVKIQNLQREIPTIGNYRNTPRPETKEDFFVKEGDVEFDIRMTTYNGFHLPVDCDIDMEIKFTIIPKPQSPQVKVFK